MPELPMFPLGTVLFPHMVLPLHIFEPRYRALMDDILVGDREFGVVLITRGHEVGGGDERTDIGTVARVVRAEQAEDGRWLVVTLGTRRIEVERWLHDDPYPRAIVRDLPEQHDDAQVVQGTDALAPRIRRIATMRQELDDAPADAAFEVSPDLDVACWQPAIVAPLTPFDGQRILKTDDCGQRLSLLDELLEGLEQTLAFRLQTGSE